jgi:hypothetical protein
VTDRVRRIGARRIAAARELVLRLDELALQTQAGTCGDPWTPCPDATTPSLVETQVDWVEAYSYNGR